MAVNSSSGKSFSTLTYFLFSFVLHSPSLLSSETLFLSLSPFFRSDAPFNDSRDHAPFVGGAPVFRLFPSFTKGDGRDIVRKHLRMDRQVGSEVFWHTRTKKFSYWGNKENRWVKLIPFTRSSLVTRIWESQRPTLLLVYRSNQKGRGNEKERLRKRKTVCIYPKNEQRVKERRERSSEVGVHLLQSEIPGTSGIARLTSFLWDTFPMNGQ